MVGLTLIVAGATLTGVCGAIEIKRFIDSKKHVEGEINDYKERTENYNLLFNELDIIKDKQKVKVIDFIKHKNYKKIIFELSTNLCTDVFLKNDDRIRQKLEVSNLTIEELRGKMSFMIRNEAIPLLPYKFVKSHEYLVRVGLDIDDSVTYWNLIKDAHLMLVGTTGSGKSRMLNSILDHLINNLSCRLYLVDLKRGLELGDYYNIKQTKAHADTLKEVDVLLQKVEAEAEKRYKYLKEKGYKDYNEFIRDFPQDKLKRAIIVIDEFADITRGKNNNNVDRIVELACKIRALGMHLILATQRPTADFLSPSIKANITGIIAMKTRDKHNSNMIIERNGCEQLQPGEAIVRLGGEEKYIRAFSFNNSITAKTVAKYQVKKIEEEKQEIDLDSVIK